jgi:hypothetical protein
MNLESGGVGLQKLNTVAIVEIVNCCDLPPAIANVERVIIKHSAQNKKNIQQPVFREGVLSKSVL